MVTMQRYQFNTSTESNPTFYKAFEIAHGMKTAAKNVATSQITAKGEEYAKTVENKEYETVKPNSALLLRCGLTNHTQAPYRFRNVECHHCRVPGHITIARRA